MTRGGQLALGALVVAAVVVAEKPESVAELIINTPALINAVLLVVVVWLFRRRRQT